MKKNWYVIFAIVSVIALPLIFKRSEQKSFTKVDEVLVVITPHNESIRYETERLFSKWYYEKTGKTVAIDWRVPGSTGEILKYVDSLYVNSFKLYWTRKLKNEWNSEVQSAFSNYKIQPSANPEEGESVGVAARREFLNSNVGSGLDILFGGGVVEFKKETEMGQLVDSGILELHPEWFTDDIIPATLAGDRLWDEKGRWVGSSLSSFGIVFNKDRLKAVGYEGYPDKWKDLTDHRFFKRVAIVDPVKSSIVVKCFEMILQQEMQQIYRNLSKNSLLSEKEIEDKAVRAGWDSGFKIIQKIMSNARYFTDASTKTVLDISAGNCSVGMLVDFYGRYQKAILIQRSGSDRVEYMMPKGGSAPSPDPIAMFRGAPNPELALAFIEFVVSEEGQKLIGLKAGSPGGPVQYALSRTPIRKDFYKEENKKYMLSPDMNPYLEALEAGDFKYNEKWTSSLFHSIRFITKSAFLDVHKEMSKAWNTINKAIKNGNESRAKRALALFEDLSAISYEEVINNIRPLVGEKNPLKEIQFESEMMNHFRNQYIKAKNIALGKL